jgi:GntR family transcriptional regulator of arabinose operon
MKKNGIHLYQHVQDHILDLIHRKELRSGDRIPAEQEMSVRMKVSRLTVRKAYSVLIEAGFLTAVQGKGTFVNDLSGIRLNGLTVGSSKGFMNKKVVGIVFPEITLFFAPILKEIEEVASRCNYALNIMFNDDFERESNAVSTMLANGVDAVIINPRRTGAHHGNANYLRLIEAGIPTVMVGKPPVGFEVDCVMCDDITGAYGAVAHLVSDGHRRILRLYSEDDAEALFERREGYSEAVCALLPGEHEHHLDCRDPEWLRQLVEKCSGKDAVTGIFSDSDSLAAQACLHLASQGILHPGPRDIVAYNSSDICRQFHLDIPTVDVPKAAMGRRAMEMVKEKLEGAQPLQNFACHSIFRPFLNEHPF